MTLHWFRSWSSSSFLKEQSNPDISFPLLSIYILIVMLYLVHYLCGCFVTLTREIHIKYPASYPTAFQTQAVVWVKLEQ